LGVLQRSAIYRDEVVGVFVRFSMRRFILKELPQQKYVLLGNGFIFSAKTENPF
jgi:hypothetical protein